MADNRGIVYIEDDKTVYRGSGLGSCIRALVAAAMGYDEARYAQTEQMLQDAAQQGELFEEHILGKLVAMGYQITQRQLTIEYQIIPSVWIRGHSDGTAKGGPDIGELLALVEIKTMSDNRFKKWISFWDRDEDPFLTEDFGKYGWQLSGYWHGMETHGGIDVAIYAVINRNSGALDIRIILQPPHTLKELKRRIIQSEMWIARDELPPCDRFGSEAYFCPFIFLHEEDDEVEPLITDVSGVVIDNLASEYSRLSKIMKDGKAAEEERKPVSKQLRDYVPAGAAKETASFRVKGTKGSSKFTMWKKLGEALELTEAEVKEKFQGTSEYEYVLVTSVKKG